MPRASHRDPKPEPFWRDLIARWKRGGGVHRELLDGAPVPCSATRRYRARHLPTTRTYVTRCAYARE
jgi:hypothetical protein